MTPLAEVLPPSGYAGLVELDQVVLDALPVAVYICSADGTIVRFNKQAVALWGRTPRLRDSEQRFCGAFRLYRLDGGYLPHADTPMEAALRTGEPQREQEVVIERPDGTRVVALVNIEPLKDSHGRIVGAINCFQDISGRRRVEEALDQARRHGRAVLDALPAAIYTTDAEGRITYFNRAAAELAGHEPVLGQDLWCVSWRLRRADGTPLPHDACPMAVALKEKRPVRGVEAVVERPDGTLVPILPHPTPVLDEAGRLAGGVNMLMDLSDRKNADRARQLLAAIIESSDDAIASKDLNGVIISWNKGAERLFGYAADEIVGRPVTVLFPEDRVDEEQGILERIRRGERIQHYETIRRRKDGTRIDVSLTVSPVKDTEGRIVGASKIARDITPRKRAEEVLARRAAQQAALYQLTSRLHRAESRGEIYEAALAAIGQALGCERSSILLLDDQGGARFVAWHGLSDGYRRAVEGHMPWDPEARFPQPVCIEDVEHAGLPDALTATVRAEGIRALAFIPLISGDRLIGKFMAYFGAARGLAGEELELALTIARQLAFSLERMRAEEARRRAEDELRRNEERERQRAAELQTIMDSAPAVIWIARDPECRTIAGNRASFEFLRLPYEANPSMTAPPAERPRHFEVLVDDRVLRPEELPVQRAARGEQVANFEEEVRFSDGTSRYLLGNATPLRDEGGKPYGAVAAFVDITDRKRAEQQRDLLIAELNHRVKNTLATVISVARQSFARDVNPNEALRSFEARLRGLARTHSRLAASSWNGVLLETLLLDELAPYRREDGSNVLVSGPMVSLSPRCALTLGMAVHELATNAAKYGGLSRKSGRVRIEWYADPTDRMLRIRWEEAGGPRVSPPARSGFGRILLERALAADLNGEVRLDFVADGLRCSIAIPLGEHAVCLS